jgi:hypothetical protein
MAADDFELRKKVVKSAARGDDGISRVWPHVVFGQKPLQPRPQLWCIIDLDQSDIIDFDQDRFVLPGRKSQTLDLSRGLHWDVQP